MGESETGRGTPPKGFGFIPFSLHRYSTQFGRYEHQVMVSALEWGARLHDWI